VGDRFEDGFIEVDEMWAPIADEKHDLGIDRMLAEPEGIRGEVLTGNCKL
jgi:hypothetical protein